MVFINDKGYLAERHGGLQPSPDPAWSHRALFHCCGPEYQAYYHSWLDFTPCDGPVSHGVDHKKRRVELTPYAAAVFANDQQLYDWLGQQWATMTAPAPEAMQAAEVQAAVVDDSSGSSGSSRIGSEPRADWFDSRGLVDTSAFGQNSTKKRKADGEVCEEAR